MISGARIDNPATTFFTPAEADATALTMNAGDDDWTYTAVHCPLGVFSSFIIAHDKDGVFLGKL